MDTDVAGKAEQRQERRGLEQCCGSVCLLVCVSGGGG